MSNLSRILGEAVLVAAIGVVLGLAGNWLSPRGLSLTRDYFPAWTPVPAPSEKPTATTDPGESTVENPQATPDPAGDVALAQGFSFLSHEETVARFQDPRREAELVIFVDARSPEHYREGHIPGAYLFYHYRPEAYLPALLPACQLAEEIVVYCNGGNCEDSELAAASLQQLGIPAERLRIYREGITRWRAEGLPLEAGERLSGMPAQNPDHGESH